MRCGVLWFAAIALCACEAVEGAFEPEGPDPPDDSAGDEPLFEPSIPTYSNQISRLMQTHCVSCHRPDGHAPNPYTSYGEVKPYIDAIRTAVITGIMPDGASRRADTGCSDDTFLDGPRVLTHDEVDTFVAWAEAGGPEGDPSEMPAPITFPASDEWQAGTPDYELVNDPSGFTVPPQLNRDIFRRFAYPTSFTSDRYVTSFEVLPGLGTTASGIGGRNGVVHHVILFIDPTGQSLRDQEAFQARTPEVPGPGYEGDVAIPPGELVALWNPGARPIRLPEGIGVEIPLGAALVMEVHYSTYNVEPVNDRTRVGLQLAPEGTPMRARTAVALRNEDFTVPADTDDYVVTATMTLTTAQRLYSIAPHMHLLGTDFLAEVTLPGDASNTCVGDFKWNFEHQNTYSVKEPLLLPAGTIIKTTCRYDNTAQNPSQFQDPPLDVTAGRASFNEMCQFIMGLVAE
jgi:hypothetical protein